MENKKTLKEKIAELEEIIKSKDENIQTLHSRLSGKHICTGYCSVCTHGIMTINNIFGGTSYLCDLEANCKDFERK